MTTNNSDDGSESQRDNDLPHRDKSREWAAKAVANVEEWGHQRRETLLLAMLEELGELTQATLEAKHEDGNPAHIQEELDDLAALMYQMQWAMSNTQIEQTK